MKRTLYTMPAVMVVLFYGMLAILAGGFSGFQPRAWLTIVMPVAAAVLLLAGRWWGSVFGMLLGGLFISIGLTGGSTAAMIFGIVVFVYYMIMGVMCFKDAQKKTPNS